MSALYPDWCASTPHTSTQAKPTRYRHVSGVAVIKVKGATYRKCPPIADVFELVTREPQNVDGEGRFEVYCAWFGVKPLKNYPRISPGVGYTIEEDYTGKVVDNISTDETTTANEPTASAESLVPTRPIRQQRVATTKDTSVATSRSAARESNGDTPVAATLPPQAPPSTKPVRGRLETTKMVVEIVGGTITIIGAIAAAILWLTR